MRDQAATSKVRVLQVINDLGRGGAQTALVRLTAGLDTDRFATEIATILPQNVFAPALAGSACRVVWLGAEGLSGVFRAVLRLQQVVDEFKPHVIHGWMYHSSVLATAAGRTSSAAIMWNIRHTPTRLSDEKLLTAWLIRLSGRLSDQPERIVYNSRTSRRWHEGAGFCGEKSLVIPNGFDTTHFRPDPEARHSVRRELGLPADDFVVGMLARYHPMKDHETFLQAAATLSRRVGNVRYLLAGPGTLDSDGLQGLVEEYGLKGRVTLLGDRPDAARLFAALDVATLTSAWGEGMPNAVGEAMACAVPVVATRVGDAPALVGSTGKITPVRDPEALSSAWEQLLNLDDERRRALGAAGRARIAADYSLDTMLEAYASLYGHHRQDGSD